MHLQISPDTRVLVDLRSKGLLRAFAHDPTLTAVPEPAAIELQDAASIDAPVDLKFSATAIEPPSGMQPSDRDKMLDILRGPEVLDAARFPTIELHGRYKGSLNGGRLQGDLVVRGHAKSISIDVGVTRDAERYLATGSWAGRLSDLGIEPVKALMGAIRLDDWIRIRVEARFSS